MNKDLIKLAGKLDITKMAYTIGGILLIIIMVIYIRKKISEAKTEKKNAEYLNDIAASINASNLTYTSVEYQTMADSLYSYLSDTRAGYAGVDEDGVYDIMSRLKTNDDVEKLIVVFGNKEIRKRWQAKSNIYTLPGAISALMSQKERDKINKRLEENGITFKF